MTGSVKTAARYRVDTHRLPPLYCIREQDAVAAAGERDEAHGRASSAIYMLVKNADGSETWDFWRTS